MAAGCRRLPVRTASSGASVQGAWGSSPAHRRLVVRDEAPQRILAHCPGGLRPAGAGRQRSVVHAGSKSTEESLRRSGNQEDGRARGQERSGGMQRRGHALLRGRGGVVPFQSRGGGQRGLPPRLRWHAVQLAGQRGAGRASAVAAAALVVGAVDAAALKVLPRAAGRARRPRLHGFGPARRGGVEQAASPARTAVQQRAQRGSRRARRHRPHHDCRQRARSQAHRRTRASWHVHMANAQHIRAAQGGSRRRREHDR